MNAGVSANTPPLFVIPPPSPGGLARGVHRIPSAPRVLPRLKRLLSDGNSSLSEVVEMVQLDPGIASRVLQVGNSARYSIGLRCYTVDEAVQRIGYDQIHEMVAGAVAGEVLEQPLAVYGIAADEFWQKSVAVALAAELLAQRAGADADIAYTVGLLHGVGQVAVNEWATKHHPELRFVSRNLPYECCEAERSILSFHQAEAGAALLRRWEFPAAMTEPVRWQYLPRGTSAYFPLAAILHVAKWIASGARGSSLRVGSIEPTLLRTADLTVESIDGAVVEVRARLARIESLLDISETETLLFFPGGDRRIVDTGVKRAS